MTWTISETYEADKISQNGNKFLIANGFMGYRGTLEEFGKEQFCAVNLLGIYDQVGAQWREPINAPNPFAIQLFAENQSLSVLDTVPIEHQQQLDFRYGIHKRHTVCALADGNQIDYQIERFMSMDDVHSLNAQIKISVLKETKIVLKVGIDGDVWDINGPHLENFQMEDEGLYSALHVQTHEQHCPMSVGQQIALSHPYQSKKVVSEQQIVNELAVTILPGQPLVVDVYAAIVHGRESYQTAACVKQSVVASAFKGYEKTLHAHQNKWDELWKSADVEVEGDPEAQRAIRYSIYHLLSLGPRHAQNLSIPARGLSGQTYKGAVFWDTEMFLFPFFLRTEPAVAKALLNYRVETLPGALKKAAMYGYEGAFYAWESQEGGYDATSDYNVTDVFTDRPMRTYFKDKQIHINGAIVHAIWSYIQGTGDDSFLLSGAGEVILACAEFYVSYSFFKPQKNRYELLDVIGPDEYHERVNNNFYTNFMAKQTVEIGLKVIQYYEKNAPKKLAAYFSTNDKEHTKSLWQDFAKRLYIPQMNEATQVIEQFDGYFDLEDVAVDTVASRLLHPREYWGGAYGVAADTQVIKQADVVLLLALFSQTFPQSTLEQNWQYYEKRTEHGSSLSACMYAILASKIGKADWAYPYFMKSATIDISGESKQFAGNIYIGGTHPAASGGAWMTIVEGFTGVTIEEEKISLDPHLPSHWQSLKFKIMHQQICYQIDIGKDYWSCKSVETL
ncbi:glycosyl hydrolase family 65 protein [Enterococcus sp. N249-2]